MALKELCGILLILTYSKRVQSASILALFSSLSSADHMVFRGYVSLLTQEGHSIVVMTPYPGQFQHPDTERIVELDVSEESKPYWEEFKLLVTNADDYFPALKAMNEYSLELAIAQLKSKQMTALFINPNIKFDLVITEADVPILYAVADKYKAPHIAITTSSGKLHQYEAKSNPIHPLLYPDVNSLYHGNLTFWHKISELKRYYQTRVEYYYNLLPLSELAAKKILGLVRSLEEVESDIDFLFIASNPLLVGVRPVVPAITYVDRMHIKPGLNLPRELQNILDAAEKGAIYFSLGAIQESEQLAVYILEVLAEAFRELPYTVLWKIGNTTMFSKPDNVITEIWFPQQQILSHPNMKAFITHGGPRSLEEAIFHEVPIIGLPLVKSRKVSIEAVTKRGAGVILDSYYLDKDTVKKAITAVITNSKYKTSMVELRAKSMDPILSGPENAILWTEYVLKNHGARDLQIPSVSFMSYYFFDLFCYLAISVFTVCYLLFVIVRFVLRRALRRFRKRDLFPTGKFKAL